MAKGRQVVMERGHGEVGRPAVAAPPREPGLVAPVIGRAGGTGGFGDGMMAAMRRGVGTRRGGGPYHVFPDRAIRGLGWLRDLPDVRDATLHKPPPPAQRFASTPGAADLHTRAHDGFRKRVSGMKSLAPTVDLSAWCSPIEDQEDLGSCTANACAGMVEYMERRASGIHIDASRLFLYKVTRMLLGLTGDTGAYLRSTMQAVVLFGMPPENWWPYDIATFDYDPDPFQYAYAANYKALQYLRLDPSGQTPSETLNAIKATLASGYVSMFGFTVYDSLDWAADIPYPTAGDKVSGGHAVLAVGYDDARKCRGTSSKGALKIRNSWGQDWGDKGYGWLPYEYVLNGLADDFWSCYKLEWVNSNAFDE